MNTRKETFIPKQYLAVISVLAAMMMGVLNGTIMNVALPTLAKEFAVEASVAIWVVNAFQLVITMLMLSFATLGDIYGYRKIFFTGVSIFVASSILCACSTSFEMLVISRILQGFGSACTMSVNIALIRLIYPPHMIGRGMAINAMVISVSAASGPTLAGLILSFASWNWLFLINLPLGLLSLVLGWKLLPNNPPNKDKRKFDKISALGNALTFGLLIYTIEGVAHSENQLLILIQFVLLVIIGTLYIRRQQKLATPILPVDLLKIPLFSLSIGSSLASFTAQMLAMVSLPFFMQNILHFDAIEIGLLMTPWPLATILTAPLSSRLLERHVHPGLLGGIGMGIFSIGLFMLYLLPEDPEKWQIIWRMFVCGMGYGLFQTPNNVTITTSAPISRSGGASGMLGTARQLGQTLGATLVALIFRFFGESSQFQTCLLCAMIFSLASMLLSMLRMPHVNRHSA